MKITTDYFRKAKEKGEKITMLTAYDYTTASLIDEAGIESILVGDSLGNTILGYDSTIPVTMEDMIHHTKAVTRGAKNALVIADMPFMSYHVSVEQSCINAGRLIKEGGAAAVKLEGGKEFAETIKAIVRCQIPVCGHIGLTPQSINAFGGFKVQGKTAEAVKKLLEDAKALEEAGVFAAVVEGVPAKVGKMISESVSYPVIGIGAGKDCDGQVLVYQDMLGMYPDFKPKFVKHFALVGDVMKKAFKDYSDEVKNGTFPAEEHTYKIKDEEIEKLY
ncbi:MAG: 3-methyl-2-oxobutanoate hydroxymethyltransferase [Clostridiales bacterium]|nr:3-methyl-2-oxobutanoate hydroxymethyltransferase [Clostridiales bacterium]